MKKDLKIMGDYTSSGLWNGKYGSMIELETLNIPNHLKKRFKRWHDNWDYYYYSKQLNLDFIYYKLKEIKIKKDTTIKKMKEKNCYKKNGIWYKKIEVLDLVAFKKYKKNNKQFYNSKKMKDILKEQKILSLLLKKYLNKDYNIYYFDDYRCFKNQNPLVKV